MNDRELYHHGILGMHWGIRRYQNEDGTLTEAGKQRYRTDSKFAKKIDDDNEKRLFKQHNIEANKAKDVRKRYEEILRTGKRKNVDALKDELGKELSKTEEAKELAALNKYLYDMQKELKKQHGEDAQLVVDRNFYDFYTGVSEKYMKKAKELALQNEDRIATAYLKDLGYDVTEKGKEFLKKNNYMEW